MENQVKSQLHKLPEDLKDPTGMDMADWFRAVIPLLKYEDFGALLYRDYMQGNLGFSSKFMSFMDGPWQDVQLVNGLEYGLLCLIQFACRNSWGELAAMVGVGLATHGYTQYAAEKAYYTKLQGTIGAMDNEAINALGGGFYEQGFSDIVFVACGWLTDITLRDYDKGFPELLGAPLLIANFVGANYFSESVNVANKVHAVSAAVGLLSSELYRYIRPKKR